jgi:AcrR family transcriptional regulator
LWRFARGRRLGAVRGARVRPDDRRPDRRGGRDLPADFFRYFADKEELFFAEDERLLGVIHDTLDAAPPGEPVLDLARLAERGPTELEALLVPKLALACFQAAYERWVRDPGQDLPALVDESFAALAGLAG